MATARENLSRNIRLLLEEHFEGNASELARELGVNPALVSRWSRGKAFPEVDQLDKLADAFHVSVSQLFLDPSNTKSTGMDLDTAIRMVNDAAREAQKARAKRSPQDS